MARRRRSRREVQRVKISSFIEELTSNGETLSTDQVNTIVEFAQKIIDDQAVEIEQLRKRLFGRRSEKVSKDQMSLFARVVGGLAETQECSEESEEAAEPPGKPSKKKRAPRRPLKVTRSEEIPVPEDERPCPECGKPRCTVGHTRCIVIEYTPPKVEVIEYKREKLACRPCDGEFVVAPLPAERVIDRAYPGPNMLSALVVNKTVDGLPLNRSKQIFKRAGVDIPIRTLNRWEGFAYQLVEPIIERIRTKVLAAHTISLDDTGLRVRDRTADGGIRTGHIWVFVGRTFDPSGDLSKTEQSVYYLYAPTWEARYPEEFLKGSTAALQGDAYRGYERIASPNRGDRVGRLLAGCCMHARRPFVQALEAKDPSAGFFVERFAKLYAIEEDAKKQKLTAPERLKLRRHASVPVMEDIRARAQELSGMPLLKPMETGVRYFVNQWDKLIVPFEQDGRLEIDNGEAERRLRRVASGRKAWLFAGSHGGAERFAGVLSLVATADSAGVDPGVYLPSVLLSVDTWPNSQIDFLLPLQWKQARDRSLEQAAE